MSCRVLVLLLSLSIMLPPSHCEAGADELQPGGDLGAALRAAAEKGGTLRLHSGTYFVAAPLHLDGATGLTLGAMPGASPVISGGRKITGWEPRGDGRWQVTLPEVAAGGWRFRELFVGGRRAIRARYPNGAATLRIAAAGVDRRTSFRFNDGDLDAWPDPGGIELVFYHDWSLSRVRMSSIDTVQRVARLADPVGQTTADHFAMDWFEKQPRYHLENHEAFVDSPGEWFLDTSSGVLTYIAREGEGDPNAAGVIAPSAVGLVRLSACQDLRLEGLTFSHSAWELPPGGCAGVQAAFHQVRPAPGEYGRATEAKPAALELVGCSGVTFAGCRFEGLGGNGLWVRNGCDRVAIEGCAFREIGANALMIGDQSASEASAAKRVSVDGCLIEGCGTTDYGAVGIWIGIAQHCQVKASELRDLPYTGISIGWRWDPSPTACHHHLVEGNHIHHVMQKLSDGGGIYTLGLQPGTVLRNNRIHDVPVNAGRAESNGMFLDEGTTGLLIEGNTVERIARSPLRFHKAGKNRVRDNLLIPSDDGIPMIRFNNTPEENIAQEGNRRQRE